MDSAVSRKKERLFSEPETLFEDLDAHAFADLLHTCADASLVLESDGTILDATSRDEAFIEYGIGSWIGQNLSAIVTRETVPKVEGLLQDSHQKKQTRPRQVNHPVPGAANDHNPEYPDLPVTYTLFSLPGTSKRVALGTNLTTAAQAQQRLVTAQLELERDYRTLADSELRFRAIFQKSVHPIFVVDGNSLKILQANPEAVLLTGRSAEKVAGQSILTLCEEDESRELDASLRRASLSGQTGSTDMAFGNSRQMSTLAIKPYREDSKVHLIVHVLNGSASTQQTGREAERENWYDAFPEALAVTDANGVVLELNERFLDITQLVTRQHAIGLDISNWVGASPVDMNVLYSQLREEGTVRRFSTLLRTDMGTAMNVTVSATLQKNSNGVSTATLMISEGNKQDGRFVVQPGSSVSPQSDFSQLVGRVPLKELIRDASDAIEKMCIEAALRQTGNNRASAADMLGVSRQSLYMKLKRHDLEDFTG
jgi:transcriptional regulator PpsR